MSDGDRVLDPSDPSGARAAFVRDLRERARALDLSTELRPVTRTALDERGKTAPVRKRCALVSVGNSAEAHGPALAPDIDDRTATHVAVAVANATGARYLGHVPFATDGVGSVAARWSPVFLPVAAFVERTSAFVGQLLTHAYDAAGVPRPEVLLVVSGHGGNAVITPYLPALEAALGIRRCAYTLAMHLTPEQLARGLTLQHAGDVEHSVALALGNGCIDRRALDELAKGFDDERALLSCLIEEPALGGMSGYYVFGDAPFDVVRTRYPGVKSSVRDFVERRRIVADATLGEAVLTYSIERIGDELTAL